MCGARLEPSGWDHTVGGGGAPPPSQPPTHTCMRVWQPVLLFLYQLDQSLHIALTQGRHPLGAEPLSAVTSMRARQRRAGTSLLPRCESSATRGRLRSSTSWMGWAWPSAIFNDQSFGGASASSTALPETSSIVAW